MNWKEWLTYNPYKKLWSLIGKRPWTYLTRDFYHKAEFGILLISLLVGFFFRHFYEDIISWFIFYPWGLLIFTLGVSTLWFILGHIFWGTTYQENQPGE